MADKTYNGTTATMSSPEISLFIPSSNMIHSDQILDIVSTPEGGVLFATSYGLSQYNGTWSTRHINRDNLSEGLMDEFITAVEYDHAGNLWIGYSGGLQIYNGRYYQTLRDQQLFKDPRIQDIQRWDNDMWVATGHSGIHRYRDGTWTWFQPMTDRGPGFYEILGMTLDSAHDSLVISTADNGTWVVISAEDPVRFEQIALKDGSWCSPQQVRRDPLGGVYFFNDTTVIHYQQDGGFHVVLYDQDLTQKEISLNDLAAASDGSLYLATDDGIYIWKDNRVFRHISRFEGIGTSEIVRTISIDATGRVWFSSEGYVGYFFEPSRSQNPIPIELNTSVTLREITVTTTVPLIVSQPLPSYTTAPGEVPKLKQQGLAPMLDPIFQALQAILAKLGITI